jgi:hypothetical protein
MLKPVLGFENYLCNKNGDFFRNGKLLKQSKTSKGYLHIRLYKKGVQFAFRSHRILYMTFKGEILKGYEINHLNGIKDDNRIENLESCTHSENIKHAVQNGLQKPRLGVDNKNSVAIYGVSITTGKRIDFASQADARRSGFNQGNIQSVLTGKRSQHKGYKWFYA